MHEWSLFLVQTERRKIKPENGVQFVIFVLQKNEMWYVTPNEDDK